MIGLISDDCSTNMFETCTAWTGGNDRHIEGQYFWDHSNTPLVFTYWYTFDPSLGSRRDCIDMLRNGKWNDRPCWFLNSFICERTSINF